METRQNGVAVYSPLQITLAAAVLVAFNGVVSETPAQQIEHIKTYVRNCVLKMFGVSEFYGSKTAIGTGITFNNVKTKLKLPAVKELATGGFAEDLPTYYNRVKPELYKWLQKATQNSAITAAVLENISVENAVPAE